MLFQSQKLCGLLWHAADLVLLIVDQVFAGVCDSVDDLAGHWEVLATVHAAHASERLLPVVAGGAAAGDL